MTDTPAISVVTATTRPDGLVMVADCLGEQTCRDFEWLICWPAGTPAPRDLLTYLADRVPEARVLHDPPRRPGDFYRLNGAWNKLARNARGGLLVFAVDWIWFEPDALELFLATHRDLPDAVVSSWAHHYRKVVHGRPEVLWNQDGRLDRVGDDARMSPDFLELSLAAVPKRLLAAVGGFDEDYDAVAGNSEKDAALRMAKVGAEFYLALSVPHRIYTHPKEDSAVLWDRKYKESCALLTRHAREIEAGTRLRVPYLEPECTPSPQ